MQLKTAINYIQKNVKEQLGVNKIPDLASKSAIVKRLADMGLIEPYNQQHCAEIALLIIKDVRKAELALTPVNDSGGLDASQESLEATDIIFGQNTSPEPVPPESSAITFNNDFEKAAIVQQQAKLSNIELSTSDCISLATRVDNKHISNQHMLSQVLDLIQDYVIQQAKQTISLTANKIQQIESIENYRDAELSNMYIEYQNRRNENADDFLKLLKSIEDSSKKFDEETKKMFLESKAKVNNGMQELADFADEFRFIARRNKGGGA